MSRDLPDPTPEEVKHVLQQAILRNYPNPDRKGCPGSPALKRAAVQQRLFEDPDWEHTSHCSPCYREFLDYRHGVLDQHARAKTSARIAVGAVVASFIIAAAVFGVVRNRAEEGRVAVRNARRHARHELEQLQKDGEISEDDLDRAEKDLEKRTHEVVAEIDELLKHKESELLTV